MARVLITGFEPFDGADVNPSWEVARLVADTPPDGLLVTPIRLSCVFGQAAEELRAAIREFTPDLVVCLGQAAGRPDVTVERVAINVDDARIPDNAGRQPVDQPVAPGGPAAYFSTLPVKACVAAVRQAGVPASLSHTAGTFVCNHVFYALMHLLATELPTVRGGFVHIPALPEQALDGSKPSLPADAAAHALRALLTAAATHTADLRVPEGATH
ncbi:pyroglutamyl-peptidase I [Kitasatospora aureofaciens]|uniref:pyroglutamyl-peptidase I n=1 Tax=Kitasatospora aureofaciens TaxID=1894 RepID=UPI000524E271|nr:pyroglutamyl-peptidase I [Kitasatospora aureofaciens]